MNQQPQSVADTPLPVPFNNSPLTPYRLLQILNFAADITCSNLTPLPPAAEQGKLHTFDALLMKMPVSHIPYQKISAVNNRQQLVESEYGAHVEEILPGSMHLIQMTAGDAKKPEEIGSCLLCTGSVILDTQLRLPCVAMQIHLRTPVTLRVQRLTDDEKNLLGYGTHQAKAIIPPCDVKLAMVMPKPNFFWEYLPGAKQPILDVRRITKNSYRLDHNIGSLKVSLQTAGISQALPDALFLTSHVLKALKLESEKTIFRPKPLKRYLGIRRSGSEKPTVESDTKIRRKKAE